MVEVAGKHLQYLVHDSSSQPMKWTESTPHPTMYILRSALLVYTTAPFKTQTFYRHLVITFYEIRGTLAPAASDQLSCIQ